MFNSFGLLLIVIKRNLKEQTQNIMVKAHIQCAKLVSVPAWLMQIVLLETKNKLLYWLQLILQY